MGTHLQQLCTRHRHANACVLFGDECVDVLLLQVVVQRVARAVVGGALAQCLLPPVAGLRNLLIDGSHFLGGGLIILQQVVSFLLQLLDFHVDGLQQGIRVCSGTASVGGT